MRHVAGAILVALSLAASVYAQAPSASDRDMVTIDGAKNPEAIPQWLVWSTAFRYFGKNGVESIPTVVYHTLRAEQRLALVRETNAAAGFERECEMRAMKVGSDLFGAARRRDRHDRLGGIAQIRNEVDPAKICSCGIPPA